MEKNLGVQINRQFRGIDEREIRTSLQEYIEKEYNPDGCKTWIVGQEFCKLSFVRIKNSIARVQLIL